MYEQSRGMSLVDVVVGTAITLIIFLALFGILRTSLMISAVSKAKAGATAIAESQMEYVRSLQYDVIGTVGGIPAGSIPQYATTTDNGITFVTRTYITYVDDAKDGSAGSDSNGIITDYKRIKVSTSYTLKEREREVVLVSNAVPPGIETTNGGGTLRVDVVDALGDVLSGATVRIINTDTSPAIDFTTFSDIGGTVFLPGAPTSTEYQIFTSKSGYSSAQTHERDAANPNPTPGYLTVVQNQTTSSTFAIDVLASFILRTLFPASEEEFLDTFVDAVHIQSLSNTAVVTGSIDLGTDVGGYVASGSALSIPIAPSTISEWGSLNASISNPALTTLTLQVLDGTNTLVPDIVLPGNSTGFSTFPVSLSGVSTTTYPSLVLRGNLGTGNPLATPSINEWSVSYEVNALPAPNVAFEMTGSKTIGSTSGGAPIYKTEVAEETDAEGIISLDLEWDSYVFQLTGYDVIDACGTPPYILAPGEDRDVSLYLGDATANYLLVSVEDVAGVPVEGASITITRTGFSDTVSSSVCGTGYFGGITASTYDISVTKTGYSPKSYEDVSVAGQTFYETTFD